MVRFLNKKTAFFCKHQKGNSLFVVIVAIGLISILVQGSVEVLRTEKVYKAKTDLHNVAMAIYYNVYANVRNHYSWENTKTAAVNLDAFSCVGADPATPAQCCLDSDYADSVCINPRVNAFTLYNSVSNTATPDILVDHLSTSQGYSLTGDICNSYPSLTCPFRYDLTWTPICMKSNCSKNGVSQVLITGKFSVAPQVFANDNKYPIEANRYSFKIIREYGLSNGGGKNDMRVYSTPGCKTLTLPKTTKAITIESWGAGGGGAGGTSKTITNSSPPAGLPQKNNYRLGGGGGGGGSYVKQTVTPLDGGEELLICVGGGGEGVRTSHLDGYDGQDSTVQVKRNGIVVATVNANGGKGGSSCNTAPPTTDCGLGGNGGVSTLTDPQKGITLNGVNGSSQNETVDQYYNPGDRQETVTGSSGTDEIQQIKFNDYFMPGDQATIDISNSDGATQSVTLLGTDTQSDAVAKVLAALQILFPDPAIITMVSQRWPGSSGSSNRAYFRFEFSGSLGYTNVNQVTSTVTSSSFGGTLSVTVSTPQQGTAPVTGVWGYVASNATYELDFFGGHGGDGGGGGGRGSINSRTNSGTKAFSPGGGGSGKKLLGDSSNNQDGADGKVIIWY
ncbi:MAG: glycine-rich domain-containing protein [Bdellovibrio sp.]